MESPAPYEGVINSLKQHYNLSAEAPVLNEALMGLDSGMKWVLKRYQRADSPKLKIGEHTGSMTGINGFVKIENGEKLIGLQVDELRKLDGMDLSATIVEDYGSDIPIKPQLTVRQYYESFGVEETLHWLQDKADVGGLAVLPPQEKRIQPGSGNNGIKYMLQPHELQGLVLQGEYFKEKYGNNPLQELEDFIKSQQA